jgi:Phospholipase_D-nuclease N-terminal
MRPGSAWSPSRHRQGTAESVVIRLLIVAAVAIYLVFWVRALIDLARRSDLSGSAKAGWAIILLVLPFIGLAVYTMVRPARL